MMRWVVLLAGASLSVACGTELECGIGTKEAGNRCVAVTSSGGGSGGSGFSDFTPTTWSLDRPYNGDPQISVSTIEGNIGCALAQSFGSEPGLPGEQVYVRISEPNYQDCPNGTFALGSTEWCTSSDASEVWPECARYRRWDTSGRQVANVVATGGAVTMSQGVDRCYVELNIVFPGGQVFEETFDVAMPQYTPGPWCTTQ